ncbi:hypothetical protein BDM02DRAFT_3159997 [Thelephora ganbajun]|uniref:Uncharacterized protein n=1 Tax=Thelephora ganbajun TaxID=370292 RepID=A0ACB6ZVG4_THEGA|nr:hypothetical protein BDM02DRAFT_3159997 [Thelephora ganbajun]
MSRYRPLHAPTIPRVEEPARKIPDEKVLLGLSTSVTIPELAGLSPDEVEFIDSVIQRAPATATTFLTVLKVYNGLLLERGLDPQNEVIYFGKLLKLGTVKGQTWKDKWDIIKDRHGYKTQPRSTPRPSPIPRDDAPSATPRRNGMTNLYNPAPTFRQSNPEYDAFTLHSSRTDDETELTQSTNTDNLGPQYHATPQRFESPVHLVLALTPGTPIPTTLARSNRYAHRTARNYIPPRWDSQSSDHTDSAPTRVSTPPSYGAAIRESAPVPTAKSHSKIQTRVAFARPQAEEKVTVASSKSRELPKSVINEDDVWAKVREARDEVEADRFRGRKLVERCWDVWIQGLEWVQTTDQQISEARDLLILRISIQKWRAKIQKRREYHQQIYAMFGSRRLKWAMDMWGMKLHAKRQIQWRDSMRSRMKAIRLNREKKLKNDAWAKWRQLYQSRLSAQHHSKHLLTRLFSRWRRRLAGVDAVEDTGETLAQVFDSRRVSKFWHRWRRASALRIAESLLAERVNLRVMNDAIAMWKKCTRNVAIAEEFKDKSIKRRALGCWKTARGRIRALERKADRHVTRQDDLLLRAVLRIWRAHERGKQLERYRAVKLLKQKWTVWQLHIRDLRYQENKALAFSVRANSSVVISTVQKWRRVLATHRNASLFAVQYHSAQLRFKMLLQWRIVLRKKLKMVRKAREADKYLHIRRAWKLWVDKLADARRRKTLRVWERRNVQAAFNQWQRLAQRQRQHRQVEDIVRERVNLRIMTATLVRWTNRVADVKFCELEVDRVYDNRTQLRAFAKWKTVCIRHVEELGLMQSYQDIKRAENMRKMFIKWLGAARTARRRRVTLQQCEEEMKHTRLLIAWDKWRERYQDIQLRPLAESFVLQKQTNIVFYAFGIWHSKTRSLPALRLNASHLKKKYWSVWRNAMPQALQSKKARDFDRNVLLNKVFRKWSETYRTKMALKAVARARYLRLPTNAPRHPAQPTRPLPTNVPTTASTANTILRRSVRSASPERPARTLIQPSPTNRPFPSPYTSVSGILGQKAGAFNEVAATSRPRFSSRASTRAVSPVRSLSSWGGRTRSPTRAIDPALTLNEEGGRGRLWNELRQVQRRSRPPTERSPSP